MTAHTHTSLVSGCYRCELNVDELEAMHAEILTEAHEVIAKVEGGEFRDGVSPGYQALVFNLIEELVAIAEYRAGR